MPLKNKKIIFLSVLAGLISSQASLGHSATLQDLSDTEMSEVTGQALMSMSFISPDDIANNMRGKGIGFYKLGMEAELDINANINKLQLGCGGINGPGACDIEIDNLSLSGNFDTSEGRVGSSAKLTNPFFEFAIKDPDSASKREMVGVRLSAEKTLGLLTIGTENSNEPNGIKSLSGYLKLKETSGVAYTNPRNLQPSNVGGQSISGVIRGIGRYPFTTTNYNLALTSAKANILVGETEISGRRITHADLNGVATIDPIDFSGTINTRINVFPVNLVSIPISARGSIAGVKANLEISQNLGFIHKINLNNPLSLSLQSEDIHWGGAAVAAQRGWWLAFEDPIDIGQLNPANRIDITDNVLSQLIQPLSDYLTSNPINCGTTILSCLPGVDIPQVNLNGQTVQFPLRDLKLATQNFAPNCYGGLKFC